MEIHQLDRLTSNGATHWTRGTSQQPQEMNSPPKIVTCRVNDCPIEFQILSSDSLKGLVHAAFSFCDLVDPNECHHLWHMTLRGVRYGCGDDELDCVQLAEDKTLNDVRAGEVLHLKYNLLDPSYHAIYIETVEPLLPDASVVDFPRFFEGRACIPSSGYHSTVDSWFY